MSGCAPESGKTEAEAPGKMEDRETRGRGPWIRQTASKWM